MNLVDELSGCAKLKFIQWVLLSAASRRVLRDQLKALLSAKTEFGGCRLRRAKITPGCKLTAYFDAIVHVEGTEGSRPRPIKVTWRLDEDADRSPGENDLAELQAEALRRGVAAPFRQLSAELAEWSMQIQVSPLDARFPKLVRLSDPRYVGAMLTGVYAAADVAQDQPRPGGYVATFIRYRPGQRHVLRYDPLGTTKAATVFAKLYTGEEGGHTFRVATMVAEWLAEQGEGVRAVRPLAHVVEDGVVLYPEIFGAPLSEHLRRPGPGVAQCLERAGAALNALHHLPQAAVGALQMHDFAAEVDQIARASDHIPVLLPSVGAAIGALLDGARELHERLPQEPPTFTHGDFKSDHVWAARDGLVLMDFDTSHIADPALDVGKFLAHLLLWHISNGQPGLEQAQERFLVGYAARGVPHERLVRARLYEVVELVKITARRVRLFDHDWAARTRQLIRRAQGVMKDLELTLGLRATRPSVRGVQKQRHTGGKWRSRPSERGARS